MAKRFWWPGAMPGQLVFIQNFQFKLGQYATILGLSPAQITAANGLCDAFIASFNATEHCKTSMLAVTRWRDEVMYGSPVGQPSPAAPVFPIITQNDFTLGVVKQFFQLRDLIVASPGYNVQIGDDLGIVGTEIAPIPPESVTPSFKPVTSAGFWINLTGSMQGMDALRVEYAHNGGQFSTVAFLTKTPGGFQVTPQIPTKPESGHIRAVFIKKNVEYGNYSADYPVTVS